MLLLEDKPQQRDIDFERTSLSTFKVYVSVMSLIRQKPGFRLSCPKTASPLHPNFKGDGVSCSSVGTESLRTRITRPSIDLRSVSVPLG